MRVLIVVIMGRWSEISACIVCQVVQLYSVVEIVVMLRFVWVCVWCISSQVCIVAVLSVCNSEPSVCCYI